MTTKVKIESLVSLAVCYKETKGLRAGEEIGFMLLFDEDDYFIPYKDVWPLGQDQLQELLDDVEAEQLRDLRDFFLKMADEIKPYADKALEIQDS